MPASREDLQSISFRDFTPGIRDNPGANYPPETASTAYRCISNPGGGLTALPRRSTVYPGNDFLSANPASGVYLVNGLMIVHPVITSSAPNPYSGIPHQVFLGVEWQDSVNHQFRLERLRLDESPFGRQTIENTSFADVSVVPSGWGLTWGVTRANRSNPLSPGIPVLFYAWAPSNNAAGWFVAEYPNDSTPTSDTPYHVTTPTIDAQPILAVHQGRVIVGQVTSYGFGSVSSFGTSENIRFSNVYDPTVWSAIENFVPEEPTGYAFFYAMSANELFLMKQTGGVVVTGDVSDPLVTNLPMVVGTRDSQRPAPTPAGLVYGSRDSGLWSWNHGDGSVLLSQYMNPSFWTLGVTEPLIVGRYSFDSCDSWVLIPNNYLYDTRTNAFWRLDDPAHAQIRFFQRADQLIYGAVSSYTHSAKNAIFTWDMTVKASTYTWTSHPVWSVLDRILETRWAIIEAKGQGTITVSYPNYVGSTVTKSVTLNATGLAERHRVPLSGKSLGLALTVVADSGDTSINAPEIYGVEIVYRSQEHLKVE